MAEEKNDNSQNTIGKVEPREIVQEMRGSYLDYAMSVIVARALPDVRDGLKPVHRRILYAMHEDGLTHTARYRKSATVIGSVLGRYHPHGDLAVYDAMARMAQDFSLRYPLVDGQGNWGCFTKDTKVKLTDGRSLSFGDLVKEQKQGKRHWTFSFNTKEQTIEVAEITKPRLTRRNAHLVEVELDNGAKIRCTPDHRFMLRNGTYQEAQYLQEQDSLMPLYLKRYEGVKDRNLKDYEMVLQPFRRTLLAQAKQHNHKVVRVSTLRKKEDVYDITVGPWHNFALDAGVFVHNSIDGDEPAAYRYTESKMKHMGEFMLQDIGKETVNFVENYDGTRMEPVVLPSPVPQLLLNGTLGIAVGMATNIPPHNLGELLDALDHLMKNPKATTEDLCEFVKGPDFPTGGTIFNRREIISSYALGKGPVVMRGKVDVVEDEKKPQIIITEIPYQVTKSTLVEQFAKLVQDKKIDGIRDIRDESDKDGLRIAFDLQRDAHPQKIINRLYKFSDLQKTFHLNLLALVDGIQPKVLSLVEILQAFLEHRRDVVTRRSLYELKKAKEREHILEGLHKCLANIDKVIKLIRGANDRDDAKTKLMKAFKLSELQANAILDMRLAQLAKLERQKIEDELKEVRAAIKELESILASKKRIDEVIKKEFAEAREMFGDERKTKVHVQGVGEIAEEDLVPQEETIITLTQGGYIKRINPATYKLQKRGGKGIVGMKTVSDDIIEHFLYCNTHDSLMVFTDSGKVFSLPVYEIPEGTRVAKGRGLLNFVELSPQDKVLNLFALGKSSPSAVGLGKKDSVEGVKYIVMLTKNGLVKKTPLEDFTNVRKSGLIAISLKKGDELRTVRKSAGEDQIIVTTRKGQSIRFKEQDARSMGRTAAGTHAIKLKKDDQVVGMDVVSEQKQEDEKAGGNYLLILTENGYGKRTHLKEYRVQTRGGSGIKTANITPKTGNLVYAKVLQGDEEDLIVISRKGQVIRTAIADIAKISRSTQGVRVMKLDEGDKVASAASF